MSRPQPCQPTWRKWSDNDPSKQLGYIFAGRNAERECDELWAFDLPGKKADYSPLYSAVKLDGMNWPQKRKQSKYTDWKPLELYNTQVGPVLQHDTPKHLSEFVHSLDKILQPTAHENREGQKADASCDTNRSAYDACRATPRKRRPSHRYYI